MKEFCHNIRRKGVTAADLKPVRSLLREWSLKRYLESRDAIRPIVLRSSTTIAEALETFAESNVSSAPVVDSGKQDDEAFSSYLARAPGAAGSADAAPCRGAGRGGAGRLGGLWIDEVEGPSSPEAERS